MAQITTLATGATRLAELKALTASNTVRDAMQAAKFEVQSLTVTGTDITAQATLVAAYDAAIQAAEVSVRATAGTANA